MPIYCPTILSLSLIHQNLVLIWYLATYLFIIYLGSPLWETMAYSFECSKCDLFIPLKLYLNKENSHYWGLNVRQI